MGRRGRSIKKKRRQGEESGHIPPAHQLEMALSPSYFSVLRRKELKESKETLRKRNKRNQRETKQNPRGCATLNQQSFLNIPETNHQALFKLPVLSRMDEQ